MTKIKICGMTRLEDAQMCAGLGADFLGFIFVRESPRYVKPERAAEIIAQITHGHRPAFVGVFRDEKPETIREIARDVGLDFVQLHGNESNETIAAIGMPAIKAFLVGDALPPVNTSAEWVLFDSGGGSGRTFDWSLLQSYDRAKPFLLAGGITPDNVERAIRTARPNAIDVATGVESAPGTKDPSKVRDLFRRVRRV